MLPGRDSCLDQCGTFRCLPAKEWYCPKCLQDGRCTVVVLWTGEPEQDCPEHAVKGA
jgi:hypothetical protein